MKMNCPKCHNDNISIEVTSATEYHDARVKRTFKPHLFGKMGDQLEEKYIPMFTEHSGSYYIDEIVAECLECGHKFEVSEEVKEKIVEMVNES